MRPTITLTSLTTFHCTHSFHTLTSTKLFCEQIGNSFNSGHVSRAFPYAYFTRIHDSSCCSCYVYRLTRYPITVEVKQASRRATSQMLGPGGPQLLVWLNIFVADHNYDFVRYRTLLMGWDRSRALVLCFSPKRRPTGGVPFLSEKGGEIRCP